MTLGGVGGWGPAIVSGRAGIFLLETPVAPYLSAGVAWMREILADGDSPANSLEASGAAVLLEAGVTAFRTAPHGRAVVCAQLLEPLFGDPLSPGHPSPTTRFCVLGGLRLLF